MQMPQLELSTFSSQIFWLLITFAVMYFIIAMFITPRISRIKDLRKGLVNDNIWKAEELKAKSKIIKEEMDRMFVEIKKIAQEKVAQAKDSSSKNIATELAKLEEELAKKAHLTEVQVDQYICSDGKKDIADLSTNIAMQLLSSMLKLQKITKENVVQVIEQVNKTKVSE